MTSQPEPLRPAPRPVWPGVYAAVLLAIAAAGAGSALAESAESVSGDSTRGGVFWMALPFVLGAASIATLIIAIATRRQPVTRTTAGAATIVIGALALLAQIAFVIALLVLGVGDGPARGAGFLVAVNAVLFLIWTLALRRLILSARRGSSAP